MIKFYKIKKFPAKKTVVVDIFFDKLYSNTGQRRGQTMMLILALILLSWGGNETDKWLIALLIGATIIDLATTIGLGLILCHM